MKVAENKKVEATAAKTCLNDCENINCLREHPSAKQDSGNLMSPAPVACADKCWISFADEIRLRPPREG